MTSPRKSWNGILELPRIANACWRCGAMQGGCYVSLLSNLRAFRTVDLLKFGGRRFMLATQVLHVCSAL